MKKVCQLVLSSAVIAASSAGAAYALPPFKKAFEETYVVVSTSDDFKAAAKTAGCAICHNKKGPKNVQNEYGLVIAEGIEGSAKERLDKAKKDGNQPAELAKVMTELAAAFKKAEETKNKAGDATYGELIKGGKLPSPPQ